MNAPVSSAGAALLDAAGLGRWRRWLGAPGLALLCRAGLAAIFLYAGIPKVLSPQTFLISVRGYSILPDVVIPVFTVVLPMMEVVAGGMLLAGLWVRPAALVIGAMTAMFLVAIASAMARGINIDCGCFSGSSHKVGVGLILRDVGMLLMLIPIFLASRRAGMAEKAP